MYSSVKWLVYSYEHRILYREQCAIDSMGCLVYSLMQDINIGQSTVYNAVEGSV